MIEIKQRMQGVIIFPYDQVKGITTMHAHTLLYTHLKNTCPTIHSKRLNVLMKAVDTLTRKQTLSITGIGRALSSNSHAKHNIKRIDRLVGNSHLMQERKDIYSSISYWLLGSLECPIILVDWSDLTTKRDVMVIRASLAIEGRSLTFVDANEMRLSPLYSQ